MSRFILFAACLVAVSGCTELGYGLPGTTRYPDSRNRDRGQYEDYSRTAEYRRITSDAASYARSIDGQLRIGNDQEGRIRDLLTDRTARLLQQTNPRDHRNVYPFPRRFSGDSRSARSFWASADRDIERILGRTDADAYRAYVRGGGRYDRRYDDRDDRRGNNGRANNGRGNNGRGNNGRANNRREDGDRGRADRDDRREDDRGTRTDRDDARRPGESLEDWYRRQAARRDG